MKVAFAGSPAFVVPIMAALHESQHELALVITPPDKPAGRGHKLTSPPVKAEALARDIMVEQPADANAPAFQHRLRHLKIDSIVVAAYGQILSREFLDVPPKGVLNAHMSLLPKYRGAAPVAWAILRGEKETGVTIMRVTPQVDSGPVLMQHSIEIGPEDTTDSLQHKLGLLAAPLMVEALDRVQAGMAQFAPQDESKATVAPSLTKRSGLISWRSSAQEIKNLVRAMNPWPLAYSFYQGGGLSAEPVQRVIILDVALAPGAGPDEASGEVVECGKEGPIVATGSGRLLIRRVKPAGSREMDGAAFVRGHHVRAGGRFTRRGGLGRSSSGE
jgi:methionyl-tRNA formyltransferase